MSRELRIGIAIPLLCMALLITSCTLDRGFALSLLTHSGNLGTIPVQTMPTSIPPAQTGGTTQRIRFASGATAAQVSGQINGTTINTYLLDAIAGQQMQILLSSPYSNAYLTVVSPNGTPLARAQNGTQSFSQTLPESGDYRLEVSAPAGTSTTTYLLNVSVTGALPTQPLPPNNYQRIRFPAGATAMDVNGSVSGDTFAGYVLEARAGQYMQINIASAGNPLYITVISPNGTPLARAQNGVQSFYQTLSESGDYTIQVSASAGTPTTNFTLTVAVTTGTPSGGVTQRITFAAGATSASVSGQVAGTNVDTYLLNAYIGQQLQVTLSSPSGTAYLNVIAPNGIPLARAQAGAQSFSGSLPVSGDYQLQVLLLGTTIETNYTLNVSVTGSGGLPSETIQRITFATGATSATVNGRIDGASMDNYLLDASAGQYMQITVASPAGEAYLTVVSPQGSPLARAQAGAQSFSGSLPETGDYRISVSSPSATAHTTYTLTVTVTGSSSSGVTQRIRFASGATSSAISGQVGGSGVDTYLLDAGGGQQMQITLSSPSGTAYLNVIAPDGSPLARAQAGAQGFSGSLPTSGDYQLQVMTLGGNPQTSYTLTVSVTG